MIILIVRSCWDMIMQVWRWFLLCALGDKIMVDITNDGYVIKGSSHHIPNGLNHMLYNGVSLLWPILSYDLLRMT